LPCQAADEIERLREQSDGWQATAAGLSEDISNAEDEIERLRIAGDLLAAALRVETVNGQMAVCDGTDEAFQAWREARLLDRSESTVWTKPVGNPAHHNGMCVDNPQEARRG
jgi:hypothetical protein